jgi:hypothetical protein
MKSPDGMKYHVNEHSTRMFEIRALNDELRINGQGGFFRLTNGIHALGYEEFSAIRAAIASFDDFRFANDPFGEHDFGKLTVNGREIIWKIDYYDKADEFHSSDPSNPELTNRYLTVMLASEY